MMQFSSNVIQIILQIPKGKVMTYGQIAEMAGNKRSARQVAWILNRSSEKYELPWHRVINSKGKISLPGEHGLYQKKLLEDEGVLIDESSKVNLKIHGYIPYIEI
ncbi:MGMT family protein [Paraliobacillus salinarum]|uniref:MGMT family protein n=1 Tax=Paraliobacillus salinarum TaxID=1158996 RepID=UPI0015F58BE8|nr:MGMT family protein [Paraliobacillus salinarum]